MGRNGATVCLSLPLVLASLASRPATAQPSSAGSEDAAADQAEAQRHFELGLTLMQAANWDGALVEFDRSLELFRTRSALFNRAMCLKNLHRPVDALAALQAWKDEFTPTARDEELRAVNDAMADLQQFLGEILIVTSLSGAVVTIDGSLAGRTPIAEPIPVAVGHHTVEAVAEGYETERATVAVGSRESTTVGFTFTPLGESPPVVPPPVAAVEGGDDGIPSHWFWVAAGTAVALGVGGSVTGALVLEAEDDYAAARSDCQAGNAAACARGPGIVDAYDDYQLATNVLLFSAGAFAATALVLGLLTDWDGEDAPANGAAVTAAPVLDPSGGATGFAVGLVVPF